MGRGKKQKNTNIRLKVVRLRAFNPRADPIQALHQARIDHYPNITINWNANQCKVLEWYTMDHEPSMPRCTTYVRIYKLRLRPLRSEWLD